MSDAPCDAWDAVELLVDSNKVLQHQNARLRDMLTELLSLQQTAAAPTPQPEPQGCDPKQETPALVESPLLTQPPRRCRTTGGFYTFRTPPPKARPSSTTPRPMVSLAQTHPGIQTQFTQPSIQYPLTSQLAQRDLMQRNPPQAPRQQQQKQQWARTSAASNPTQPQKGITQQQLGKPLVVMGAPVSPTGNCVPARDGPLAWSLARPALGRRQVVQRRPRSSNSAFSPSSTFYSVYSGESPDNNPHASGGA
eukprot:Protomagalhaensia_sp_Gyna_25__1595@NODE_1821_length_1499_cov_24_158219_g1496_i0_p1_GENE_NODE_1821_length_1499_cov_24_158219_g1496_i0NODE_1821_length_1499_cov_24_158219_g1496_i0_p1_ORF_typecomplete_len251_score31_77PRCH/PF03967_13/0_021_NODE_1821_length_1499_cov_24_158219_g1496_i081833